MSGTNEKKSRFSIKFRGVRGSYPTPSKDNLKYGGNTACVEVNVNGHLIIIDAGTGLIDLGTDLMREHIASGSNEETRTPITAVMLLSHMHLDHVQGLPFFKPAYLSSSRLHLFGPKTMDDDVEVALSKNMFNSFFPLELDETAANFCIKNIKETEVILLYPDNPEPHVVRIHSKEMENIPQDTVIIRCMKCYAHPREGVHIYRIEWNNKAVVYASDKESYVGSDRKLTTFARNADLLIHDAQYTHEDYTSPVVPKQGFGHSTPEMAIDAAQQANVNQLILFHLDPTYDDNLVDKIELAAKSQFAHTQVAYEGLEINLV